MDNIITIIMSHSVAGLSALLINYGVQIALLQEVTKSQKLLETNFKSVSYKAEVDIDINSPYSVA